jgi:uncharacterized repeat protein (TIGR03847 family)
MADDVELDEVDHLTAGTVGPPGQRIFYLQAASGDRLVSLRLEKGQVAALVRYIDALLADLPPVETSFVHPSQPDMSLREPVVAEWVVGAMGVSYDEVADRLVLVAQEFVEVDEDDPVVHGDDEQPRSVRISATRAQAAALAAHGAELVAAGRPVCSLCGLPIDPEGHTCPRLNGHPRPTS